MIGRRIFSLVGVWHVFFLVKRIPHTWLLGGLILSNEDKGASLMPFFLSSVQQGDCKTGHLFTMTLLMSEGAGAGLLVIFSWWLYWCQKELQLGCTPFLHQSSVPAGSHFTHVADGKAGRPEMRLLGRPELCCGLSTGSRAASGAHVWAPCLCTARKKAGRFSFSSLSLVIFIVQDTNTRNG